MTRYALFVSRPLIPALAAACLATGSLAQQGPPEGLSVNVVNTPSVRVLNTPLPVTGTVAIVNPPNAPSPSVTISNPADIAKAMGVQHPITFMLTFTNIGTNTNYTVPSNQHLIIEYAAGSCKLSDASLDNLVIRAKSNSNDLFFPVNLPFLASTASNPQALGNFAHLVRIYADPASVISLATNGTGGGSNPSYVCFATLSGQLIDNP